MGTYLNPVNLGFKTISKGDYIDKTGIIDIINKTIGTNNNLICNCSPRRFGKSWTARMLCDYYNCTFDSGELFSDFEIARSDSFRLHMNKYNVIFLDISGFYLRAVIDKNNKTEIVNDIKESIKCDLVCAAPELEAVTDLNDCMLCYVKKTNKKFIFIIDEWDIIFRKAKYDTEAHKEYLNMLREWFQNDEFTSEAVAATYLTGIMPIKKKSNESELPDFKEFTIIDPSIFTKYTGFTEEEVQIICNKYNVDFDETKKWYERRSSDGITPMYNPFSVMKAVTSGDFTSYWQNTSVAAYITKLVDTDQYGLQGDVLRLIVGDSVMVDLNHFQNDYADITSKDDVLSLLVYLGALVYDPTTKSVRIPNEETRMEFKHFIRCPGNSNYKNLTAASKNLIYDILNGNAPSISDYIKQIQYSYYDPVSYDQAAILKYVIKIAFIVSNEYYLMVEELPSAYGIADTVFLPKNDTALPAMVFELKLNEADGGGIDRIKDGQNPVIFKDYRGELALVGIKLDSKTNDYSCKIEKIHI